MIVRPKGGVLMFMCPDGALCSIGVYPSDIPKEGSYMLFHVSGAGAVV